MATSSRARWLRGALIVVLALVAFDQWSKAAVFAWLERAESSFVEPGSTSPIEVDPHGHRRIPLAGEWLTFMRSCNPGAAFGQFGDYPVVLVAGRCLAVAFLGFLLWRRAPAQRSVHAAVVLVLAGALGNVIDNLFTGCPSSRIEAAASAWHPREVRDFLDVWFRPLFGWDYHFPSFNVADSCITVGACLWVLAGLLPRRADAPAASAESASR